MREFSIPTLFFVTPHNEDPSHCHPLSIQQATGEYNKRWIKHSLIGVRILSLCRNLQLWKTHPKVPFDKGIENPSL